MMLVELSILPLASDGHVSDELAEVLELVDAYGLPYQLTPSSTCIEGQWAEVMELVRQCHERVRSRSSHVVTIVKIEDEEGTSNKLTDNIKSVEQKAGRQLSSSVNSREGEVEAPVPQSGRQEERVRRSPHQRLRVFRCWCGENATEK